MIHYRATDSTYKMIHHSYFIIVIILLSFTSCHKEESKYILKETGNRLLFPIDNQTKNSPKTLFVYADKGNKQYLTFQNPNRNEILFYDLSSCNLEFKTSYDIEGMNGVGNIWGYYIHNLDSIFVTSRDLPEIYLTNHEGKLLKTFSYENTEEGSTLSTYCSTSFLSMPGILKENRFFIMPSCNRHITPNPICATINLGTAKVNALPLTYPAFPGTDNELKKAGIELYVSRCFNTKGFVYSFYFDEDLYVTDIEHQTFRKIKTPSSNFEHVTVPDDYGNTTFKDMCEISNYGNILYDKYRDVYYRIAYPKTNITNDIRPLELMDFGRKNFSIIILDKDFNILGETLFPDFTYNSTLMFITEDGLYISDSHYLNPKFSDDELSFKRFELVKINQ